MEYPLLIDGAPRGRFTVEQSGLYTVLEAELGGVHDGMYRLWVHGGGECAYLGLMQPWSGGMYLRRKLSRRELESFPKEIDHASDNEEAGLHKKGNLERQDVKTDENIECDLHNAQIEPEEKPDGKAPSCPYPAPIPEEGDELLWFRRPDNSLVSFDGLSSLVALPAELRRNVRGAVLRRIDGKEYMVFRY